jgi:hypothetical protein
MMLFAARKKKNAAPKKKLVAQSGSLPACESSGRIQTTFD